MKNLKAPFLVIALFLNVLLVTAENESGPPAPNLSSKTMTAGDCDDSDGIPCNEQGNIPIDQNIIILVIGGLALGLTAIYRNQIKKASI
ncbi:hypothetical protein NU08_1649 [Flavobacterium anhuiense]|uniref:Uncharacterized protein n=1 Tax=Flavobacterium anhuiense TaxID=459526 RepID=A0A444W0C4_9FLAO|nr:hypothetical protein [Flavobacterium anhuiense]RYJ39341.1 hypothetical protein NU08_1649 [Flavobacterium anhuiense]